MTDSGVETRYLSRAVRLSLASAKLQPNITRHSRLVVSITCQVCGKALSLPFCWCTAPSVSMHQKEEDDDDDDDDDDVDDGDGGDGGDDVTRLL